MRRQLYQRALISTGLPVRGVTGTSPDGLSPREQLDAIRARAQELVARKTLFFESELKPLLRAGGVRIAEWARPQPEKPVLRLSFSGPAPEMQA